MNLNYHIFPLTFIKEEQSAFYLTKGSQEIDKEIGYYYSYFSWKRKCFKPDFLESEVFEGYFQKAVRKFF